MRHKRDMKARRKFFRDHFQDADAVFGKTWQDEMADDDATTDNATVINVKGGPDLMDHGFQGSKG